VTKPFSLRELQARVKANLRRADLGQSGIDRFSIGPCTFDCKTYEATRNQTSIYFTPLEFHILQLMVKKKGIVVTREDFLNEVWGVDNVVITDRTVDSHIANIRKKIEPNPSEPQYILSIRGVGYKLKA
jgi:two-component system alkaline phosphatase synthesis response regulator PhoP